MLLSLVAALALSAVPSNWACDPQQYADGVCDCGCTAADSDCTSTNFAACERSGCTGGQVPWEHQNASCMASACGDGWKADAEACDDGNALASGGCNSNCSAVNPGYTCGDRATGCSVVSAPDAGQPDSGELDAGSASEPADAGSSDEAAVDGGAPHPHEEEPPSGGCSSMPGAPLLTILGAALFAARRSRRRH